MKPYGVSRGSMTIHHIWDTKGRRPTLRRSCKVFIPRDLRGLDTLRLPATCEEDPFLLNKLKMVTRHKLHHWVLVVAISCYLYSGAVLFQYLEANYGQMSPFNMSHPRESFLRKAWNDSQLLDEQGWFRYIRQELVSHEAKILEAGNHGYTGDRKKGERPAWGLPKAIFYCFTIVTTVGYGNIAPSTDAGRAATIIYAFLGIPLMLMVLADLGKLFTKAIKFVFRYVRRFYKTGSFRKDKTTAPQNKTLQYMTVSWRTVNKRSSSPQRMQRSGSVMPSTDPSFNQVTSLTLHNDDLYKDVDSANADGEITKHVEVEDEFNLPVSLAVALVLIYMVLGALIFTIWEDWTFFEAFYFVFISMSTVGFGDFVPSHPSYMMAAFLYLVFGLTLTSMCINVIQEKLSATFQKAKVRIGTTIGLDVNTLIDRPRSPKSELADLHKTNGLGVKATYHHKDSVCGTPSRATSPVPSGEYSCPPSPVDMGGGVEGYGGGKEVLVNLPLQNRWTFYDSPYNTVHSDSAVPVPSRAGSTISVNRCRL